MANSRDYLDHVLELMGTTGAVTARPMFGGHGIYVDAMIVGIVVADVLYLKTDAETRPVFITAGLEPFTYTRKKTGDVQDTSYFRPPDDALENAPAMREWLQLAMRAAVRSAAKKAAVKPRSKGKPPRR